MLAIAAAGFFLFCVAGLLMAQRSMIYPGTKLEVVDYGRLIPANVAKIEHEGAQGERLVAWYVPPRSGAAVPERLWAVFHGNYALALDWIEFVDTVPDDGAGFLLVDYPGYGLCEGKPSREGIIAAGSSAFGALAAHLEMEPDDLAARTDAMGMSLGAAAALEFAARHPVRRVVLLAPFTSLKAMADRSVTPALSWLLRDRFDNVARLQELAGREAPPTVHIFHGTDDEIIPFAMSERMAQEFPSLVVLHPVKGATHNWVLEAAREDVKRTMAEGAAP